MSHSENHKKVKKWVGKCENEMGDYRNVWNGLVPTKVKNLEHLSHKLTGVQLWCARGPRLSLTQWHHQVWTKWTHVNQWTFENIYWRRGFKISTALLGLLLSIYITSRPNINVHNYNSVPHSFPIVFLITHSLFI